MAATLKIKSDSDPDLFFFTYYWLESKQTQNCAGIDLDTPDLWSPLVQV